MSFGPQRKDCPSRVVVQKTHRSASVLDSVQTRKEVLKERQRVTRETFFFVYAVSNNMYAF